MNVPKTPYEFDYDLWTAGNGKCMVRVKRTGEVTEVDRETFRFLRAEEKAFRRKAGKNNTSTVLSLDECTGDDIRDASWLIDNENHIDHLILKILIQNFLKELTQIERFIFIKHLLDRVPIRTLATEIGLSKSHTWEIADTLNKNLKNFCNFSGQTQKKCPL